MEDQIEAITPNFELDDVPNIKIKSLRIRNFKAYENWNMDFTQNSKCKEFVCFIGDNGVGKSTALSAIQLIFTRFEGYSIARVRSMLGKCVRHAKMSYGGLYGDEDFLLEADIQSSLGDYSVSLNKSGFIKDHPEKIKMIVYRLCYSTRFDQELNQFQLIRSKWDMFKSLFESVTGYEIEEAFDLFSASDDPIQAEMMEKYVLGFTIKKPYETISHKECSNGEKKVVKSFSTLLNLEIRPKILLIDDIAMHVSSDRQLLLISAMQACYPDSQIFSSAHSYRITKNLKIKSQIYDLRLLHASEMIAKEPWRQKLIDEIEDALYKLEGLDSDQNQNLYNTGKKLLVTCSYEIEDLQKFRLEVSSFLKEVTDLYVIGILSS